MSEQEELCDFVRCPGNDPFCLGMTEYNCCGILPKPKRSKLSLAKMKALALSPTSQFNVTITEEDIDKSSKGCIPAGTVESTSWAVRTFQQWITRLLFCKASTDYQGQIFVLLQAINQLYQRWSLVF